MADSYEANPKPKGGESSQEDAHFSTSPVDYFLSDQFAHIFEDERHSDAPPEPKIDHRPEDSSKPGGRNDEDDYVEATLRMFDDFADQAYWDSVGGRPEEPSRADQQQPDAQPEPDNGVQQAQGDSSRPPAADQPHQAE